METFARAAMSFIVGVEERRAIGGGGAFRGALQFTRDTWASVGGRGDPAAAPLREQLRRGAILLRRSGRGPWPVCGA